ncbi:MAG: ABC transporter substrate-binding protein [Janthinobacterium lividum]
MHLTRRSLLAVSAASATLPALAQGTPPAGIPYGLKPGKPYAGSKLNILAVVTPQFQALEKRQAEFTALTGITTSWDFVPFPALQDKVTSIGVGSDDTYDVVNYLDGWGPPNAPWFVRLDPLLKRDGLSMDRYPAGFVKAVSFQGAVIGLPMRSHGQLFYYRKDVFDQIGLRPPESWDDVVAAGKAIRAKRSDIEPLALSYHNDGTRQALFHWCDFIWSSGNRILDDQMRPGWTTEGAIKATEYYVGLLTRDKVANPASISFVEQDARVSFQQGKSAMIPIWEWAYSPMVTPGQSVLTAAQVGFTRWPSYEGKAITCASTLPFSLNGFSRKQDAAWEFMKWLSNPDLDKRNAIEREVGGLKIINNVVNETSSFLDPEVNAANAGVPRACYDSLKASDTLPMIPEWPQVGDLLANAIEQAAGGGNVRALITKAAADATSVLKQAGYN